MSGLLVDDDPVVTGSKALERLLAALDDATEIADRHDTLDVAVPVTDPNNPACDLDDRRLVNERRESVVLHTRILLLPSRAAEFSITSIKFKEHFSLKDSSLAAFNHSRLTAQTSSTERSPSPTGGRFRAGGIAPAFGPSIQGAVPPTMARHIVHNALDHRARRHENRHD